MGGASNRLFSLLSTTTTAAAAAASPAVLLHPRSHFLGLRRSHLLTISSSSSSSGRRHHFHFSSPRHFQSSASNQFSPSPLPEWSRLLEALSSAGYFDRSLQSVADDDQLLSSTSPEFARAATVCLQFARERSGLLRLLSKRDVEIVTAAGIPFLFKNANVQDTGELTTINLMRFILSHVRNLVFPSETGQLSNRERIEPSVRKLLSEMAKLCYVVPDSSSFALAQDKFAQRNGERSARPSMRQIEMKRGDWICPRCRFMNFARNVKCIECEEDRPATRLTGGEWECPQCDFFNYGKNAVCLRCDCKCPRENVTGSKNASNLNRADDVDPGLVENKNDDFPDIMPLRKGVNRFVVSTRKTQLERRLTNSQYQDNLSYGRAVEGNSGGGRNSTYVPFVPLPADMFAKKPENTVTEVAAINETEAISQKPSNEEDSNMDKDKRWFQQFAEVHHSADGSSAKSEEEFPEIMPARNGENRFVVSKKKDRSLTSPAYKRQMAMEQASNTKFVPFVPFPPDYFAKKNDQNQTPSNSTAMPQTLSDRVQPIDKPSSFQNSNSEPSVGNADINKANTSYEPLVARNFSPDASNKDMLHKTQNSAGGSFQRSDDRNIRDGKSLEGSAVKEPDPLDMSEEAKAARWFRRVAQIKDISELSQIPDEDFPSIMPMRKGVNRFVVSKRKTPLERRLTSPQYRRNLPTVSSDPVDNNE